MSKKSILKFRQEYHNSDTRPVMGHEIWREDNGRLECGQFRIDGLKAMGMLKMNRGAPLLPKIDNSGYLKGKDFKMIGNDYMFGNLCKIWTYTDDTGAYRIYKVLKKPSTPPVTATILGIQVGTDAP
jgi:hypothetical protein